MSIPGQSNRTHFDVNRVGPIGSHKNGKKSWKLLKEKLKHHKPGSGSNWTSTVPVPASDVPLHSATNRFTPRPQTSDNNNSPPVGANLRSRSSMFQRTSSRAVERGSASSRFDSSSLNLPPQQEEEEEEIQVEPPPEETGGGEKKVRMSLMALLAETDKEMGIDGSSYMMGDDDDDEEEDENEDEDENEGIHGDFVHGVGDGNSICSVCRVNHNGNASTACGHTYCRLCSKELQVQNGGSCPLCNSFILEILNIF